jgi:hypothetical protein
MKELRVLAERWRVHYHIGRPHFAGLQATLVRGLATSNMGCGEVETATHFPLSPHPRRQLLNSEIVALDQFTQRHIKIGHSRLAAGISWTPVRAGKKSYISNELERKTYSVDVTGDGTMSNPKLCAERGGEGVVEDEKGDVYGDVYIVAGQIYVYDRGGG